jgi:hypothetical protein
MFAVKNKHDKIKKNLSCFMLFHLKLVLLFLLKNLYDYWIHSPKGFYFHNCTQATAQPGYENIGFQPKRTNKKSYTFVLFRFLTEKWAGGFQ